MSDRHLIQRQVVELTVPARLDAQTLQTIVSRLCQDNLPALLDRLCGQTADPNIVYRLPHLALDLGRLPATAFENEFVDRLAALFAPALEQELAWLPAAARDPVNDSLELLTTFLSGGMLPWWADAQERGLLSRHVALLAGRGTPAQQQALHTLLRDAAAGRRLAAHLDDSLLERLLAAQRPDMAAWAAWRPRLLAALQGQADQWQTTAPALRAAAWGELLALSGNQPAGDLVAAGLRFPAVILLRLALRLGVTTGRLLADLHRAGDEELQRNLDQLPFDGATAAMAAGAAAAAPRAEAVVDTAHALSNAGLVLLWPFLSQLWEQLALLENGRFVTLAAQQRAVFISQALVMAEVPWPEYDLLLNKILCGLPLAAELPAPVPLTERELAACEALLSAVIDQVPIFGKMSTAQLRDTFLQRPGTLAAEAGGWLVNVERRTYDIVLERIPWPLTWVRLPWMDHLIRVAW
ncbi:MAG: hypothetical protein H6651_22070 [Ardenticatenales bacterium]|nr:hypothetical protein [Ardenticatenales bacterium]